VSHFLLVAAGGAIGAVARHLVGGFALKHLGAGFPYGTLAVNVVGSLAMGLLIALFARHGIAGGGARLFLATGVLGGFTTFSAFSLEVALLWERGEPGLAALYITLSVAAAVAALFGGLAIVRAFD
jgi:CrcB protein